MSETNKLQHNIEVRPHVHPHKPHRGREVEFQEAMKRAAEVYQKHIGFVSDKPHGGVDYLA